MKFYERYAGPIFLAAIGTSVAIMIALIWWGISALT